MQDTSVRDIGSRLEPLIDDWLFESMQGSALRLHSPQPREIALPFDRPWEGDVSFYVTILEHEGAYRAYYRGWQAEGAPAIQAVALSNDGISWRRPVLGLHEWQDSRENNIILTGKVAEDGFVPFYDHNPVVPAAERWKAVGVEFPQGEPVLMPYVSEDGYSWHRWRDRPILTDGAFDSQNVAYWDAYRGQYVAFYRDFVDIEKTGQRYRGIRSIKWATSPDFEHWTAGQWFDFGGQPLEHLYTNAATPYPRAPHIYLAFPKRFLPERKAIPHHTHQGASDAVFMTSRDGLHWDRRFMEAFIRPGRDRENWTERNICVAFGIQQTAPDELSVYWVEHYRHPTCRLRRGTVRLDGFASLNAGFAGGEALTRPLLFEGRELTLNYATSAAGSVRVELQDAEGHTLPGYDLEACPDMYGDQIEQAVSWRGGGDLTHLAGQPIRLRLVLTDADVYSLRFR